MVPIVVGVIMLMHADTTREWVFGSAWMAAGGLLLARSFGWLDFRLKDFWPLVLVAIGIKLIWRDTPDTTPTDARPGGNVEMGAGRGFEEDLEADAGMPPEPARFDQPPPIPPPPPQFTSGPETRREERARAREAQTREREAQREARREARRNAQGWCSTSSPFEGRTPWRHWESWDGWRGKHWRPRRGHIRMLALMSGIERRLRAETFASAEMTAIMGACELDLRQAEMQGGEAHISAFALWGGIEIRVPDHWAVVNRSMALMGGVEDTTRHVDDASRPRLFVHGFALMAGIEIRN